MTLRKLFTRDVYIRLAEDEDAFTCTIRRYPLPAKVTDFPVVNNLLSNEGLVRRLAGRISSHATDASRSAN